SRPATLTGRLKRSTAVGLVIWSVAGMAAAGPQGGTVIGGQAQIRQTGPVTNVNQGTSKAIIDWKTFDVGQQETVNFNQPSASAITLNRVKTGPASQIQGAINAPGNVWVVNPQGVMITQTAQINVGGFLASTADIENEDFLSGNFEFDIPGSPDATVLNEGKITFGEAGLVGLVAPTAANAGVIAGKLGKVQIAGTDAFAIDLAGDGILALPTGNAPTLRAGNTGTISNAGGYVLIDAATAEGVLESVLFSDGVIEATTFQQQEGRVVLTAGDGAMISGRVDVTGETGGAIDVTADSVILTSTAELDASGDSGGGAIRIGGDVRGSGELKIAKGVHVRKDAVLRADGRVDGDGGKVVLFSSDATLFFGAISAEGGTLGGNGGFVEVSGGFVAPRGTVDLAAPNGVKGSFLIDPDVIEISNRAIYAGEGLGNYDAVSDPVVNSNNSGNIAFGDLSFVDAFAGYSIEDVSVITPEFITSQSGTVLLEAVSQINVVEAVTGNLNALDLTLRSGGGISITSNLQINGNLSLESGAAQAVGTPTAFFDGIYLGSNTTVSATNALGFTLGAGQRLLLGGGNTISSGAGLTLPTTEVNGTATINVTGGDLTQAAGSSITGEYVEGFSPASIVANSGANDIILDQIGNAIDGFSASGNNITLVNNPTGALEIFSPNEFGLSIDAAGNVDIDTANALVFADSSSGSVFGGEVVDIIGTGDFRAGGSITTGAANRLTIGGNASFQAFDDQGDANTSNDTFSNIDLRAAGTDNVFGGTLSLVGDSVSVTAAGNLDIVDSYAQTELTVISRGNQIDLTRVAVGTFDEGGGLTADLDTGGNITLEKSFFGGGGFFLNDVFGDVLSFRGPMGEGPIQGDIVIDDFELTTIQTDNAFSGDLTLSDGQVDSILISDGLPENLTMTSVNFTNTPTFLNTNQTFAGTVHLNGIRPDALVFEAARVELGFIETTGFVGIASSGDIVKVPDADLLAGQGG
ncbi:MAG: filamentous hemagglutinin N-terminal domain-containing protein, partial [Pseudomonadota bacterium]